MKQQGISRWQGYLRAGLGLLLFCQYGYAAAPAIDDDCSRAVAPQRCQLHRQGLRSCQDLGESRRRTCLAYYTPPLNCQRQRDAKRCEALVAAQTSCEGALGAARRKCVDERLPAAGCSRGQPGCATADEGCDGGRRRDARECAPPLPLGD
ncbi:hypothetical protein BUE93_00635 [Chromobacterium amazonense]|uniref:Uncharacterized protein n=1 Tax=Chromobacterium amazonense TaxID=1382803 RepID=A0A2S9XA16_9NEIS|nr:hypothetical protein [Chromobacterium amazonense]PRP72574.1 hypothetical protein BUE93_00635 [Chromobacterium amazonense]